MKTLLIKPGRQTIAHVEIVSVYRQIQSVMRKRLEKLFYTGVINA